MISKSEFLAAEVAILSGHCPLTYIPLFWALPADRVVAGSIISQNRIKIQEVGTTFALQMAPPWRGSDGNSPVC